MNNSVRGLHERNERTVPLYQIHSKVQSIVVHSTSVLTLKLLFFLHNKNTMDIFQIHRSLFVCFLVLSEA